MWKGNMKWKRYNGFNKQKRGEWKKLLRRVMEYMVNQKEVYMCVDNG